MYFKNVVIGSGFAGSVIARLIAEGRNEKVLLVEKRNHIGGNAYDCYDENGILIHKYGPHIFHTNNKKVWDFLSRFTEWRLYQHQVLAYIDGKFVPFPINVDTINLLFATNYNSSNIMEFFDSVRVKVDQISNSEDVIISQVGYELFEKFFKNYTKKQWDLFPNELSSEVTSRIPVRNNRDGRYFTDKYQGIPKNGYTKMFENILDHPNIHILLNTDFKDIRDNIKFEKLFYTGRIDEFFDYKYGKLDFRSLRFEFESYNMDYYQKVGTVNYPNDYDFTRITEFKHLSGQISPVTTIVKEFPTSNGEPYYPILNVKNIDLIKKYQADAVKLDNIWFLGRLGTYKYLNMDTVVEKAFELFESLKIC